MDVLDIPSISDAVAEASRMLRRGIVHAMSSNVYDPPAPISKAATPSNAANTGASTTTSRDPFSVYSAVTKRPRKPSTPSDAAAADSTLAANRDPISVYSAVTTKVTRRPTDESNGVADTSNTSQHPLRPPPGLDTAALRDWDRDKKAGRSILSKRSRPASADVAGMSVFQPAAKRERREKMASAVKAAAKNAAAKNAAAKLAAKNAAKNAAKPPVTPTTSTATTPEVKTVVEDVVKATATEVPPQKTVKAAEAMQQKNGEIKQAVHTLVSERVPLAQGVIKAQGVTKVQGETKVQGVDKIAIVVRSTSKAEQIANAKASAKKNLSGKVGKSEGNSSGLKNGPSKQINGAITKATTQAKPKMASLAKSKPTLVAKAAKKAGTGHNIQTVQGTMAAIANAGRTGQRRALPSHWGQVTSSADAIGRRTNALSTLCKKVSGGVGVATRTVTRDGRNESGSSALPADQQRELARRGGITALGIHSVRGAATPTATATAMDSVLPKPSAGGLNIQYIPGSKTINGVRANGYTVTDKGVVKPIVTFTSKPKVPHKLRQTSLNKMFSVWTTERKVADADALEKSLQTEQELYAQAAGRSEYRGAMVSKLKDIRSGS